jgi:hypothetical protein
MKTNATKNINKWYKMLLLMLIVSLSCTSCSDIGIEGGFKTYSLGRSECEYNPFHCTYKAEKTEFDIDDVSIILYYGGEFYDYQFESDYQEYGLRIPSFDIYAAGDWDRKNQKFDNEHLIKHVEEPFISEKYDCEIIRKQFPFWHTTEIIYNHCETITIPRELFIENSGGVNIDIRGIDPRGNIIRIVGTCFYYKVVGETVLLSGKSFK